MSTAEEAKSALKRMKWENRNCPHCGGEGLLIVFHASWSGSRFAMRREWSETRGEFVEVPFPAEVGAHCYCPVGQWHRDRTDPELQRRIPWVADILAGRSRWLLSPPQAQPDADEPPAAPTRNQINSMFRRPA